MLNKANFKLAVFILMFSATALLLATVVTHNETGLKFQIPDDWTFDQEGDAFMATSSDESVFLYFYVGHFEDVSDLLDNITDELDSLFDYAEIGEDAVEEEINGLLQIYVEGTGEIDGEAVDFDLTIVIGGSKPMLIVALGDVENNQETLDDIYVSVQR
jgi:predicted Zn-dependent protease